MPTTRVKRPLDPNAAQAADQEVYRRHHHDPRPNALYDEQGNRKPLSPTDAGQTPLRQEWVKSYQDNGGKVETPPATSKAVGSAVQTCSTERAAPAAGPVSSPTAQTKLKQSLTVHVRYRPLDAPVTPVEVTISGPVTLTQMTDASGVALFADIPPGAYQIKAEYKGVHPLVEKAKAQVGSTTWAFEADRSPYHPKNSNKCNAFVKDMTDAAGYAVALHERFSWSRAAQVKYPPLAAEWADPAASIGSTTVVTDPLPGDVIAHADPGEAWSGHVGIVSYPMYVGLAGSDVQSTEVTEVAPGENAEATVRMHRLTISATGAEITNGVWGWRESQLGESFTYRRFK